MKKVKNYSAALVVLILLVFSGCDKIEDLIKIKVEETNTITIPPFVTVNLPIDIISPPQESSLEQELSINDSRKDKVKTIRLKELKLTITNPTGRGFGFLNSIRLFINAQGLNEREIGYYENIPDDATGELRLNIYPDDDLAAYLKQETFTIKASLTTDEIVPTETTVEVYTRFEVTADIL